MMEQVLEYLEMENYESWPAAIPKDIAEHSPEDKKILADEIILKILEHYEYTKFDLGNPTVSKINPPEKEGMKIKYAVVGETECGDVVMQPKGTNLEDEVMSYSSNLTQWTIQLMLMNEIAHAADIEKHLVATKMNIPFFYSHSTLSKYFIECVDYVIKTSHSCSPQVAMRIMDGTFINTKGGLGKNVETDLVKEHSIRSRKELINSLGANKSEQAILRVTSAADTVAVLTGNFSRTIGVEPNLGSHTKSISDEDRDTIREILREQRPFHYESGRKFKSKFSVPWSPFSNVDHDGLAKALERNSERLLRGLNVACDEDDEDVATEQDGLPDVDLDVDEYFA